MTVLCTPGVYPRSGTLCAMTRRAALPLFTFLLVLAAPVLASAQDVLVITTDDLRPGLADWLEYRRGQGHDVEVAGPGESVQFTIRETHARGEKRLTHVLLLGDVDRVPCAYETAIAIAPWETDDRIATDTPLADVTGDGVPDVALGRIPVSTPEEARTVLARSIAYERSAPGGDWPRRLGIVAGVGGFGAQQDMALEMLTRMVLNRDIPEGVATQMIYAKETSAFCPPPSQLQQEMLASLNDGALAVAYVGHGSARHLDRMSWDRKRWPILEAEAVGALDCTSGAPLLIFVACSTGQYDAGEDCLAELALKQPHGPAAIIASSRVSTPYGNGLLAVELLDALYRGEDATAGGVLLTAKQVLLSGTGGAPSRKTVEAMASSFFEPDPAKRARDRLEHTYLYQLFGDPLLRLRRPAAARLTPPAGLTAGETVKIPLRSPVAGHATVELTPRRDAFAQPKRPGRSEEQMATDHAASNVSPVAVAEADADADSTVLVELTVPADLRPGRYLLRAWIAGDDANAMAGVPVRVDAPR